jgi:hypothetical protein
MRRRAELVRRDLRMSPTHFALALAAGAKLSCAEAKSSIIAAVALVAFGGFRKEGH